MYKRQERFFKKSERILHSRQVCLKKNSVEEILVTSGCENKEMFELYRYLLYSGYDRAGVFLDYEICKEEIKRIGMIIAKNDNSIDLIDGI